MAKKKVVEVYEPDVEAMIVEEREEVFVKSPKLHCANPFTFVQFTPGTVVKLHEIDAWTKSQLDAGILVRC